MVICNNKNGDVMYYLNNFLFFSILGHIFESIIFLFLNNNGYSGILFGPWTPVYGLGIIIIILINKILDKYNFKLINKIIVSFLTYGIILSLIEYIGGISIELLFHNVFWDYSNHKFNIGKYISIEMALLWGLVSSIYLFVFKKLTDKFINKIPSYLTWALFIIFICDFLTTIIDKLKI